MARAALPIEQPLPDALAADLAGAFERLVVTYQHQLYGFALRLTGNRQDAEEVVQDTFIRAYRALEGYPSTQVAALALRPWLYRIALNLARNRARGRRLRLVPLDAAGEQDTVRPELATDETRSPGATVERAEQGDELGALLAALPERYRLAVMLRHVAGLSYREVAAVLGQPDGTVKANVHRGVRLLRIALTVDHEPGRQSSGGLS